MSLQRTFTQQRGQLADVAALLLLAGAVCPVPGIAAESDEGITRSKYVGQYFLSDDHTEISGGGAIYGNCTHDGSMVGAIPLSSGDRAVYKFISTYWVNDPDPSIPPYSSWPVPDALDGMKRLFLCYNVEWISGATLPWLTGEFCDWAPRDLKRPLAVDFAIGGAPDGVRDLLIGVDYRGGKRLCAGPAESTR